jgi:hypothetical protein
MSDPNAYIMLLTSLPSPEALFLAKRPPLSRLRLNARMRVLTPEDAEVLNLTEGVLHWGELPIEMRDEEVVARARKALAQIENETIRAIIRDRLELRTCLAAVRRRHRGESAPPPGGGWGYGRWVKHIERNWGEETFRLDKVFPWLREAIRLMKSGETMKLQRLSLEQAWKSVARYKGEHYFDFEAVVIYVLQWSIVERWGRYNDEEARARFEEMAEAARAAMGPLFDAEPAA